MLAVQFVLWITQQLEHRRHPRHVYAHAHAHARAETLTLIALRVRLDGSFQLRTTTNRRYQRT